MAELNNIQTESLVAYTRSAIQINQNNVCLCIHTVGGLTYVDIYIYRISEWFTINCKFNDPDSNPIPNE